MRYKNSKLQNTISQLFLHLPMSRRAVISYKSCRSNLQIVQYQSSDSKLQVVQEHFWVLIPDQSINSHWSYQKLEKESDRQRITRGLLLVVCCRRKVENSQDVYLRSKLVCKHPFLHHLHTIYLQNTISHPTLRAHAAPALTSLGYFPCTLVLSEGTLQIGMQTLFSHT